MVSMNQFGRLTRHGCAVIGLLLLAACSSTGGLESCEAAGGRYIEAHQECMDISASACSDMGGKFHECASPCRHEPEAAACIMRCDTVCDLDQPLWRAGRQFFPSFP
ncbi:MAG TPA: hypothetical protein VIM96_05285 [Pseudomonadales bacterium]